MVALGATAALSLLGKAIAGDQDARRRSIERDDGLRVFMTIHPSFILRIPDRRRQGRPSGSGFWRDMIAVARLIA